ncbi:hypothetical protein [Sorangium sp. So ce1078]|uniref:hypothetical protein n=1 Tax=Sorangium sp. So ce1078 TaxID=3133329 RepID=UPI003F5F30F1
MADFYSQAFNFPGAIQGGVDPRTGLYVVNMPVARLVGNANLGPSLDLTLRYDPLGGAARRPASATASAWGCRSTMPATSSSPCRPATATR